MHIANAEFFREQRHAGQPLRGPINVGEVFAWEPDHPRIAQFCVVSRVEHINGDIVIWSYDFPDYEKLVWNTDSRFREACYRTPFQRMPASRAEVMKPVPADLLLRIESMLFLPATANDA